MSRQYIRQEIVRDMKRFNIIPQCHLKDTKFSETLTIISSITSRRYGHFI